MCEEDGETRKPWDRQRIGTNGVVDIFLREVKFNDQEKMDESESIPQRCFHRSRTKVGGSKTIRYRRSLNHKRCRLGIGCRIPFSVSLLFSEGKGHGMEIEKKHMCVVYWQWMCVDRIDSSRTVERNREVDGLRGEYGRKAET